jgi:hypothetical protein
MANQYVVLPHELDEDDVNTLIEAREFLYRKTGTTTYNAWYSQAINNAALTTRGSLLSNFLHGVPFIVGKDCVADRIAMEITVAGTAGSKVRLGIYRDNGNNVPGTLLVDAGLINGDSATVQSITINATLNRGIYWLAWVHNAASAPTFRAIDAVALPNVFGQPSTLGATARTLLAVSNAYGALPSTFPAFTDSDIFGGADPAIWLRLSA